MSTTNNNAQGPNENSSANKGYLNINSAIKNKIFCCIYTTTNTDCGNIKNSEINAENIKGKETEITLKEALKIEDEVHVENVELP